MQVLENNFKKNPGLKARFETQTKNMRKAISERKARIQMLRTEGTPVYIPIVFHIVLNNPSLVTDAQIQNQVDQLNRDFGGVNGDSTRIRPAFKQFFAKTNIQFRLAQRNPGNEPSNGIERVTTSHANFGLNDSRVKYTSAGGADAWDNSRFFNVWITDLSQPDPYYVIPVLMAVTMFWQTKITPTTADPAQQRIMMIMPLMFSVFFLWAPSGLVIYWFVSNLWAIGQQYLTNRLIGPAPVQAVRPPAERQLKNVGAGRTTNAEKRP